MSPRRVSSLLLLAGVGQAAFGHHSIGRVYDESQQSELSGTVAEFRFINPHPMLILEVTTGSGRTERWRLEMDNRSELVQVGMTADTFAPGDRVVVEGSPSRTQSRTIYLRRLERLEDGLRYEQVGYSPRLTP